ncbi:MAG TPA: nucleotidyltransferase family protein [Casimicrobiaceae bacterium]
MRIVGILLAAGSGRRFGGDKLRHPIGAVLRPGAHSPADARTPNHATPPGLPLPLARGGGESATPPLPLPLAGEGRGEGVRLQSSPSLPAADAVPLGVVACRNLVDALPDSIAVVRVGDVTLNALLRGAGARVIECADAASGMGRSLACAIAATRDADGWVVALADMPWVSVATIRTIAGALQDGAVLAAPSFNGVRGNPVGFSSACAEALMRLEGDRGARDLVAAAGAQLQIVAVDDAGVLRDVDVAADLSPRATRLPAA